MRQFIIILLASLSLACSTDKPLSSPDIVRPGNGGTQPQEPEEDFSIFLADNTIRFVSSSQTLSFDYGGVLYSADGTKHRFIDLNSGTIIRFDSSVPSLTINGQSVNVDECQILDDRSGIRWYLLRPGNQIVVVESSD